MAEGARLAMIGVGRHAADYHVPAIEAHPEARLVAVADPSPETVGPLAARTDARPFADAETMLAQAGGDLDAVVIASPHTLHHRHASLAIERGLHVLLEKPMVTRTTDALDLVGRASATNVLLAVGFNRHLDPANLYARDLIRQEALGAVEVLRPLGWQYRWDVRHYGRGGEPTDVPALPPGSTTTANFVDAILGRGTLSGTADDGVRATRVMEAAYESAQTQRSVALP